MTQTTTTASLTSVVARNSAFVLGSQALLRIAGFAFNVYVVRRLGAALFGQYATVMAYIAVFGIFTDLGLAPFSVREMAEDRSRTASLLLNIVAIRLVLSLVVVCLAPLSALWLGKGHDLVIGILVASVGQLVWAFQGPLASALTARERLDYDATFAVAERLVFWLLGTLLLIGGSGFVGLIAASLVGLGVRALLSGWALFRRLDAPSPSLTVQSWPGLLRRALPFGVSGIAFVLRSRFDTLLLSFTLTDEAVGWYNVPVTLIGMMLLLATSVGQSMYPSMVRAHRTDRQALRQLVRRAVKYLLIISLPIAIGGIVVSDRIIVTLYTSEFSKSTPILRIMLCALPSLFLLELLGRLCNTLHLERQLARVTVINAVITVGLNLVLVYTLGIVGAALALVAGRTVNVVQNWSLIGRERLIGDTWVDLLRVALAAGLMGSGVFLMRQMPLALSISAGTALYAALLVGFGAVTKDEMAQLAKVVVGRGGVRARARHPIDTGGGEP